MEPLPDANALDPAISWPRRRTLFSSSNSMVPEPSTSQLSKSCADACRPGRPSCSKPMMNSFLEMTPSPFVSMSRKRSITRAAAALSAWRRATSGGTLESERSALKEALCEASVRVA